MKRGGVSKVEKLTWLETLGQQLSKLRMIMDVQAMLRADLRADLETSRG